MSDFGLSTSYGPEHTAETGTYRSMAPEVITHQAYDYKCDVYKPSSFEMGPNGELLIHQATRTAEDERALESKRCVWCAQYGVKTCALRHGADPYHAQGHPIQGPLPDFLSMA